MKIRETLTIAALVLLAIVSYGQQATVDDFGYNTFYDQNYPNDSLLFRMLEPYQYNHLDQAEYPVFIWLHPNGRQGTNNTNQMGDGWAPYLMDSTMRVSFPAFVIAPQCPPNSGWWHDMPNDMVFLLLDSLKNAENIDAGRIYVMGWSLGGFGTWLSAISVLFVNTIGVCENCIEFCPDNEPPLREEELSWIWSYRPDLSDEFLKLELSDDFRMLINYYKESEMDKFWDYIS